MGQFNLDTNAVITIDTLDKGVLQGRTQDGTEVTMKVANRVNRYIRAAQLSTFRVDKVNEDGLVYWIKALGQPNGDSRPQNVVQPTEVGPVVHDLALVKGLVQKVRGNLKEGSPNYKTLSKALDVLGS